MTTIEAMKQALSLIRWHHFGECRTDDGQLPEPAQVDKLLREAIAAEEAQGVESVYLVATGLVHDEQETYTRHDVRPPLCDAEKLFSHPAPPSTRERDALIGRLRGMVDSARLRGPNFTPSLTCDDVAGIADMLAADADEIAVYEKSCAELSTAYMKAQQVAVPLGSFAHWLQREMPTGTIISDPYWWATRIYKAVLAAAPQPPQADALAADHADTVRYCYECGSIGDVPKGKRDCCPDGSHAKRVHRVIAEQAQGGFHAMLADFSLSADHIGNAAEMVPITEDQLATALNSFGSSGLLIRIARAVERHHKIGVTP